MSRGQLSRSLIAEQALRLIDEGGLGEFTMRKLGVRLGVDPMAVYRHYRDREDLFDAVAERILDEVGLDALPWDGGWRLLAEMYCLRLRDALLAHPHAVSTFATRPVRASAAVTAGARMVEVFNREGFSPGHALQIARSLRELVIGHAMSLASVRLGSQTRSRKPAPGSADYNLLAAAADAIGIEDHFEVALAAILDGFTALQQHDCGDRAGA